MFGTEFNWHDRGLLTLVWVLGSHGSRHGLVLEDTDLAIAFIAGGPHTRWFLGSARIWAIFIDDGQAVLGGSILRGDLRLVDLSGEILSLGFFGGGSWGGTCGDGWGLHAYHVALDRVWLLRFRCRLIHHCRLYFVFKANLSTKILILISFQIFDNNLLRCLFTTSILSRDWEWIRLCLVLAKYWWAGGGGGPTFIALHGLLSYSLLLSNGVAWC